MVWTRKQKQKGGNRRMIGEMLVDRLISRIDFISERVTGRR